MDSFAGEIARFLFFLCSGGAFLHYRQLATTEGWTLGGFKELAYLHISVECYSYSQLHLYTMNTDEFEHLIRLKIESIRRLHQLEIQVARLGISCPPHLLPEIEDLQGKIASIESRTEQSPTLHMEYQIQAFGNSSSIFTYQELSSTMSNRHYEKDVNILEGNWDQRRVAGNNTIFVITGCGVLCELLDRPVAEVVRDKIDAQGQTAFERAIIISDRWWYEDNSLAAHPVISIGRPTVNLLTKEITEQGSFGNIGGIYRAMSRTENLRIALWGDSATQTRKSAELFTSEKEGLSRFLSIVWRI